MNELPPPTRLVRKTPYGRTELYLPSATSIMREIKCMGGMGRHASARVYHVLPEAHLTTPISCWHCCETISDPRTLIPLPRMYDTSEHVYHVYGATCSPSCAKAYIVEHTSFDRGQHLNVLVKMLREVYGVNEPVLAAPPRPAFRRFGGPFDPTALRKVECALVHAPFVSYSMIVEECTKESTNMDIAYAPPVEDDSQLDEPHPEGVYDDFVKQSDRAPTAKRTRTTPGAAGAAGSAVRQHTPGPMSKFFKRNESE